jgi:DNA-nicking Smr family endonuclease
LKEDNTLMDETEFVEQPIDGILDLHTFQPKEAASVVDEYLRVCREKGILEVKIIHGKGRGVLLQTVHALLEKHPFVLNFNLDSEGSGWGATIVYLRKNTEDRRQ